jgi:hypothetical protein
LARQFELVPWDLLGLLGKDPKDDDSTAGRGQVNRARNTVPTAYPKLSQFLVEMLHAIYRQPFETDLLDDAGAPCEPRSHVDWERFDLGVDNSVQRLDGPSHANRLSQKSDYVQPLNRPVTLRPQIGQEGGSRSRNCPGRPPFVPLANRGDTGIFPR